MNAKILILAISAAALASCSTAYRTGQTPDDVYFSPTRSYAVVNNQEDEVRKQPNYYEDREIWMSIRNPRWRSFDYDYYNYTPYYYGFNYGYYYNPYYCSYPVYNTFTFHPVTPKNTTPRTTNLAGYYNGYNNNNTNYIKTSPAKPVRSYKGRSGNRSSYSPYDYDGATENNSGNSRTYTPSSGNSGNFSSGSSSGSGGISRPSRNGK